MPTNQNTADNQIGRYLPIVVLIFGQVLTAYGTVQVIQRDIYYINSELSQVSERVNYLERKNNL